MIFRQLFDPYSYTYTYLLACSQSREAALIDPVLDSVERDLELVQQLDLKLRMTVETHIHADHISGASNIREVAGSRIAHPAMDELPCADIGIREGETVTIGSIELHPLFTPGHTNHHYAYLIDDGTHQMAFTGDALLIDACGRTDFQSGDSATLYQSIHEKLFTLPAETLVYPCHDYDLRHVSSIGQEKARNPRLGHGITLEKFVENMEQHELPYPANIEFSVASNQRCGVCSGDIPEEFEEPCALHNQG
jgi:glyoxylase-like metal-dependent hydrolase (beta-lactamase superfamily II)